MERSSARLERTDWPPRRPRAAGERASVGIVVANFNTCQLIAGLVFSLYRLLGPAEFSQLVIVDNASADGSRELLEALERAGLITLIRNSDQRYHGPALTQGISWLARRQSMVAPRHQLDYVWLLDSDVIVLRPDTVRDAVAVLERPNVGAVGERAYDPWRQHSLLQLFSLMLDPALIWRTPLPPFLEDGSPSAALQVAAETSGLRLVGFPFLGERYVLHIGRGTLREIAHNRDTDNRYHDWATGHRDYHYSGDPAGPQLHHEFNQLLASEAGDLNPVALADACRKPGLLTLI
jgi:hypothetical protein